MKMILVLMALSGCGQAALREAHNGASLVQGGPSVPVDCFATCESSRAQLVRDFGFQNAQVNCSSFSQAHDCGACQTAFRQAFGLELLGCN